MKQLQVTAPKKYKEKVEEILSDFSSDISSNEAEKNDEEVVEFKVTSESEDIDELTEELKSVKDIESGDLSIRVLEQKGLIEKGQKTRGSSSMLSQEEIYSKAQESSSFNRAQWGLIALSSIIASYGLVADNVIVVIGAMMLAPILSPFVSGALSLTVGDRKMMSTSLKTGALSALIAVLFSFLAALPFSVSSNPTLTLVSQPSIISVLLAVFVGAAAALTFATGLRDQIAGVAVAIALVPPIASVGISLKMQSLSLLTNSLTVAGMNMLAVLISGFVCFRVIGLKPSTYYKEKQAEKIRYIIPAAFIVFSLLAVSAAYPSYSSYEVHSMEEQLKSDAEEFFGEQLIHSRFSETSAMFYVVGDVNETRFKEETSGNFDIEVVELQKIS